MTRPGRRMLAVATVGYFLSVWAWALPAPLAPVLRDTLGLTPVQQALLVALPVVVGSVGRVPVGALTDRFGGRVVFLFVVLATIAVLLELAAVGHRSVAALMIGVTLLGVAGTTFAAGVPFVTAWFPETRRGLAIGVLGMGLCGSAVAGLTAVRLARAAGAAAPYLVSAAALAAFMVFAAVVMRDAPRGPVPVERMGRRIASALRLRITWLGSLWYAVAFGLFVTFTSYLPAYLSNAYDVSTDRAADVMAAFVLLAVLMRPVGGWLADRWSPARPLTAALFVATVATAVQAFGPPLPVVVSVTLPLVAVAAGVASAAALAQVAVTAPAQAVGLVTGIVTAVAGLAGFASPLVMALSLGRWGGYGPALGLLAGGAAAAAVAALAALGVADRTRPAAA